MALIGARLDGMIQDAKEDPLETLSTGTCTVAQYRTIEALVVSPPRLSNFYLPKKMPSQRTEGQW